MKLRKTDKRFKLYQFGFDCYIEFDTDNGDYLDFIRYQRYCNKTLGEQFLYFRDAVFQNGKYYISNRHRKKNSYYKRIYFRGEKNYTLLLIAMPLEDKNTFRL